MSPQVSQFSPNIKPVIGSVHLRPLPGSPGYQGDLNAIHENALQDAESLVDGGVDGLILENLGDAPFFPTRVPAHTAAHMAAIAVEIRRRFKVPLGINVLRNDGLSALAVAHAAGAEFIRVNVLNAARITDQGIIEGIAHELMRERRKLDAVHIRVFADFRVKHSAALREERPLADEVSDMVERAGANALIVTGTSTGKEADPEELARVSAVAGDTPVLAGSGMTVENLDRFYRVADGFIVGTHFKKDGVVENPVVPDRVKTFMERLGKLLER
jgi:membrane complex biogenesis BtpA family protein